MNAEHVSEAVALSKFIECYSPKYVILINLYNKKTWGIIHLVRAQKLPKNINSLPLIHIRACAFLGVRNISFSDDFAFHIWIKRTYWMNDPFGPNFLNTFQKKSCTGVWASKYFRMHYKVKWIKPGPGLFSGIFNFKK